MSGLGSPCTQTRERDVRSGAMEGEARWAQARMRAPTGAYPAPEFGDGGSIGCTSFRRCLSSGVLPHAINVR